MQEATQSGGVRPFGVSLLVSGWDKDAGVALYQVDPSGSYWAWKASAIGKNMVNAKTFLEKRYVFVSFVFNSELQVYSNGFADACFTLLCLYSVSRSPLADHAI